MKPASCIISRLFHDYPVKNPTHPASTWQVTFITTPCGFRSPPLKPVIELKSEVCGFAAKGTAVGRLLDRFDFNPFVFAKLFF